MVGEWLTLSMVPSTKIQNPINMYPLDNFDGANRVILPPSETEPQHTPKSLFNPH